MARNPLTQARRQDLFNRAVAGLTSQGFARSLDESGHACRYRAPDGKKCAIGHLIADPDYSPKFEGKSVPGLMDIPWKVSYLFLREDEHFLEALQDAHDAGGTPQEMVRYLQDVGAAYELIFPKELVYKEKE